VRIWGPRIAGGVVLVALIVVAVLFGPILRYVMDDQKLDGIAMTVALEWREFGIEKAKERLQYELDHQSVGAEIGDDTCALTEADGQKVVACAWGVDYAIPGVGRSIPLGFQSRATITASGDLR
jgi:hypothetical protein